MGLMSRLLSGGARSIRPEPSLQITATLYDSVPVVGESHYQPALRAVTGTAIEEAVEAEHFAELVPEPSNPYDPNAVKVLIDGRKIGHLSRENAVRFGPKIKAMAERGKPLICSCFVGCAPETGNPNIGVSLQFPVSEQVHTSG
jgi:hypothetical protein